MRTDAPTESAVPDMQKVAARSLRIGDRIPVLPGTVPVRLSSTAGLATGKCVIATVTATEYRRLHFQYVTVDTYADPLIFLTGEGVAILPRRPAADDPR
jgi:hypothetical protein